MHFYIPGQKRTPGQLGGTYGFWDNLPGMPTYILIYRADIGLQHVGQPACHSACPTIYETCPEDFLPSFFTVQSLYIDILLGWTSHSGLFQTPGWTSIGWFTFAGTVPAPNHNHIYSLSVPWRHSFL